jgi:hypothetical protein
MVHAPSQIIELNHHTCPGQIAIKEGIIRPVPLIASVTEEQLNRLREPGYNVDGPDGSF